MGTTHAGTRVCERIFAITVLFYHIGTHIYPGSLIVFIIEGLYEFKVSTSGLSEFRAILLVASDSFLRIFDRKICLVSKVEEECCGIFDKNGFL